MKNLGFIGGGRITRILLKGFKNAGVQFENIFVYETNETVLKALKAEFSYIETSTSDITKASSSDWVFVALHPPVLMEVLQLMKSSVKKEGLVISLAPKITIERIQTVLPDVSNLARMNPNAGTFVNKGYNPVCFSKNADKKVVKQFIEVFEKLGKVPVVPENQIEAYAVISAMGHTYFWYQLQQIKELALSYGLSEAEANETIAAMLQGTSETLFSSGLNYEKVIDLVPVKPMAEHENTIRDFYKTCLNNIYTKIKPA